MIRPITHAQAAILRIARLPDRFSEHRTLIDHLGCRCAWAWAYEQLAQTEVPRDIGVVAAYFAVDSPTDPYFTTFMEDCIRPIDDFISTVGGGQVYDIRNELLRRFTEPVLLPEQVAILQAAPLPTLRGGEMKNENGTCCLWGWAFEVLSGETLDPGFLGRNDRRVRTFFREAFLATSQTDYLINKLLPATETVDRFINMFS